MANRFFTSIMTAVIFTTAAAAQDKRCDNTYFVRANPTLCKSSSGSDTLMALVGGALLVGAGAFALGTAGGGGESSNGTQSRTMTTKIYDTVGRTDESSLNTALAGEGYTLNYDHYNEIRLAYSLARGYTGAGAVIGVLDSGDYGWHGAAVAEIAGSVIAPGADLNQHKVVDDRGDFLSYSEIGRIIGSANDTTVFNSSWNVERSATAIRNRADIIQITGHEFINNMIDAANRNAVFVWSAGNDYSAQSGALSMIGGVIPELDGHFINVVAWDTAAGQLADFSNQCGITMNWCITAPGTDIDTLAKQNISGTSFAAPMVSGAIAVLQEMFPYMVASDITKLLFATARDLGYDGVDEVYGHGMMDLERATRPVGAETVPLANGMTTARHASAGGAIARKLRSANLQFAFFDGFGRAFTANLNDNISFRDQSRAFDRLRMHDPRITLSAGNLEFGFSNENLVSTDGFLKTDEENLISFVGIKNEFNIGNINFFQSVRIGYSAPRTSDDSFITDLSNIYSASLKFGANYGDWTLSVSMPEHIIDGELSMTLPRGRNNDGDIQFATYNMDLAERPALEYTAKYKFISATYIDNPDFRDEFFMMARGQVMF